MMARVARGIFSGSCWRACAHPPTQSLTRSLTYTHPQSYSHTFKGVEQPAREDSPPRCLQGACLTDTHSHACTCTPSPTYPDAASNPHVKILLQDACEMLALTSGRRTRVQSLLQCSAVLAKMTQSDASSVPPPHSSTEAGVGAGWAGGWGMRRRGMAEMSPGDLMWFRHLQSARGVMESRRRHSTARAPCFLSSAPSCRSSSSLSRQVRAERGER